MTHTGGSIVRSVLAGAVGGAVGSWVKAAAEAPLQTLAERVVPPAPGEKDLVGADSTGQPENMPPAVLIGEVGPRLTGSQPTETQAAVAGQALHYGIGVGLGVAYALVARSVPGVTRLLGIPAGAAMYVTTHGSTVPALGLQRPPWDLPASAVLWESGSHLVFGAVVETVRRALVDAPLARS